MDLFKLFINIFSPVIGYFIGSILPAYILPRAFKKTDIREQGTGIAGTMNVYRTLGKVYAVPVAIFDTLKGLLAIFLAFILGAEYFFVHLSGLAAILGHIFPFYIRFKGGRGLACATGILIYYMINYFILGLEMLFFLLYLGLLIAIFAYITKTGKIIGVIVLPLLGFTVFLYYFHVGYNLFFWIIIGYIFSICIYHIVRDKIFRIENETFSIHWWRTATRPFAILFVLFYVFYSQTVALMVIGIVAICFIGLDLFRFLHKQTNVVLTEKVKALFRKGEERRFSSMTLFLVATFISIILFEKNIAIIASTFLIFGDIFAKIFGLAFGRHNISRFDKTVEGTLAYYGCVLICGYILYTTLNVNLMILIIGGISAPLIELFSFNINDNFTVSLISGTIMTAGKFFGL